MPVESAVDLASFFEEDEFAEAATYTPSGGSPVSVSIVVDRERPVEGLGEIALALPRTILRVRVSEIAEPKVGDTFEVASVPYTVDDPPTRDATGLIWEVGVH